MLFPRMPTRLGPPPPPQNWIDLNAALGPSSRSSPSVGERPGEPRPQVDGHDATGSILGTHPAQHAAGMTLSLHPAPSHLHELDSTVSSGRHPIPQS
jgi:hypothetical protein